MPIYGKIFKNLRQNQKPINLTVKFGNSWSTHFIIVMNLDGPGWSQIFADVFIKGKKKASNHKELGQSEQSIPKGETNRFKQYT